MKRRHLFLAGVLVLGAVVSGCRRPPREAAPLRPPSAETLFPALDSDGIAREGIAAAGGSFEWELPEAASGRLRFAWTATGPPGPVALVAETARNREDRTPRALGRFTRVCGSGPAAVFWSEDLLVPTSGARRILRLRAQPARPIFLSDLRLVAPDESSPAVVLLVFDTTRADAVGFGGSRDATTPNLDAILRDAWKARRAYAAASWTIPSMASLLTGRVPAALEDSDGAPLGIPKDVATAAGDFRRSRWSTAAFVANPTLRRENGFASGFTTFFTTPYDPGSVVLPAAETLRRVPAWLAAHRGEPFLLWIHLMDPHDPYSAPDRPRGVTAFDPGYRGSFVGDEVNRLQLGDPPPASPADARHLQALSHEEVRYADAQFGALWNAQPARERARWTFAFTADHGEEFGEHGGWKHGPALYDVVLRVPLAIRPGRGAHPIAIPPDALVSLVDLAPTLEALAGLAPSTGPRDGRALLDPDAGNREALPPVTMLTGGAPRAVVVHLRRKLFFFDRLGTRGIPDAVRDPSGYRLAKRLPEIQPGLVSFDLVSDPGETRPAAIDRTTFPSDWRAIERAMAHTRRGLELRVTGAGPVRIRLRGLSRDARAEGFALAENDRLAWSRGASGAVLEALLHPSEGVAGLLLDDASGAPLRIEMPEGGGCADLRLAGARPVVLAPAAPQEVPRAALPEEIPLFETRPGCASLYLWKAAGGRRIRSPEEESEEVRKLRALGYLH